MTDAPGSAPSTVGLHRAVVGDDQREIGVPMLLHTTASLDGAPADTFSTAGYLRQAALGRLLLETGALPAGRVAEASGAQLLALNFHAVPPSKRATAAERIRRAVDLGDAYDPDTAVSGPQVLVAFYDGDLDTGRWADELCAALGVRAYYFPVTSTAVAAGPRLDEDDLALIAQRHELCYHTASHRSAAEITPANLDAEVLEPLARLTRAAGRGPRLAAWRGGARFDPSTLGDATIREHGVRHLASNWSIERIETLGQS